MAPCCPTPNPICENLRNLRTPAAGGCTLKQLAADLLQATDPDRIQKVAEASRLSSSENLQQAAAATFQFFSQEAETTKSEGAYLPHWHQDGVIYFVTFRLADSLPQEKLAAFAEEKERWLEQNPEPHTPEQKADFHQRFPQRLQQWLDLGYGSMILQIPEANQLVQNAITHFDGDRYRLDEFVVAANHVHVLVAPQAGHSLNDILHSWMFHRQAASQAPRGCKAHHRPDRLAEGILGSHRPLRSQPEQIP